MHAHGHAGTCMGFWAMAAPPFLPCLCVARATVLVPSIQESLIKSLSQINLEIVMETNCHILRSTAYFVLPNVLGLGPFWAGQRRFRVNMLGFGAQGGANGPSDDAERRGTMYNAMLHLWNGLSMLGGAGSGVGQVLHGGTGGHKSTCISRPGEWCNMCGLGYSCTLQGLML